MNILLINQCWFAKEFRDLGHNVKSYGHLDGLDIVDRRSFVYWKEIEHQLLADFKADLIIFYDDSSAINILGLEEINVPTIFYSVDTHHHSNFHSYLGLFFSHTFVAQKDYLPAFESLGIKASWMPLWASQFLEPMERKEHQAVFVGTLDPKLNPARVSFFEELKKICQIEVLSGDFAQLFPASEIVVNQTVKGDLNFRVFESMISGAMLLTEKTSNGLFDLFQEGKHLVTYEKGNVQDAAEKIAYYLGNKAKVSEISRNGRDEIIKAHLPVHRARQILDSSDVLSRPDKQPNIFGLIGNYIVLSSIAKKQGNNKVGIIFDFEALRLARLACSKKHYLDDYVCVFILSALMGLKSELSFQAITEFLDMLLEFDASKNIFKVARIGIASMSNDHQMARQFAAELNPSEIDTIINSSAKFLSDLNTTISG